MKKDLNIISIILARLTEIADYIESIGEKTVMTADRERLPTYR